MERKSRIFIAGQNNIVGHALYRRLSKEGFTNLLPESPSRLNIFDQKSVRSFFKKERPEYCFLPSIREGGIEANIKYPADLIYENLIAQANIIHAAWQVKVRRLIFLASSCVYPKDCSQPMKEEYLLTGGLEPTNEPYALAKLAGIKMCQAYNRQYRVNFISIIPATSFGPNDNFDRGSSHVIPALINKFHKAKIANKPSVVIWGTGKPLREFIYVDDLVDACLFLMNKEVSLELVNVGTGEEISIKNLALLLKDISGFKGNIKFDDKKPDGVFRKLLYTRRLTSLGWEPRVGFKNGLEATYQLYLKRAKNRKAINS